MRRKVPAGDVLPIERPAVRVAEDQRAVVAEVAVSGPELGAEAILLGLQAPQFCHEIGRDVDRALASGRETISRATFRATCLAMTGNGR